jgi:hypothetical protein
LLLSFMKLLIEDAYYLLSAHCVATGSSRVPHVQD